MTFPLERHFLVFPGAMNFAKYYGTDSPIHDAYGGFGLAWRLQQSLKQSARHSKCLFLGYTQGFWRRESIKYEKQTFQKAFYVLEQFAG